MNIAGAWTANSGFYPSYEGTPPNGRYNLLLEHQWNEDVTIRKLRFTIYLAPTSIRTDDIAWQVIHERVTHTGTQSDATLQSGDFLIAEGDIPAATPEGIITIECDVDLRKTATSTSYNIRFQMFTPTGGTTSSGSPANVFSTDTLAEGMPVHWQVARAENVDTLDALPVDWLP